MALTAGSRGALLARGVGRSTDLALRGAVSRALSSFPFPVCGVSSAATAPLPYDLSSEFMNVSTATFISPSESGPSLVGDPDLREIDREIIERERLDALDVRHGAVSNHDVLLPRLRGSGRALGRARRLARAVRARRLARRKCIDRGAAARGQGNRRRRQQALAKSRGR